MSNDLSASAKIERTPCEHGVATINLPSYGCDIDLVLPNGSIIHIEYQTTHPSLHIGLYEDTMVTSLIGDATPTQPFLGLSTDGEKERKQFEPGHVRLTRNLIVELPKDCLMHSRGNN